MNHLDKKILERIEQEHIRVRPRWFFYVQDISSLAIALALMVLASLFFGVALAFVAHGVGEISLIHFPYTIMVLFFGSMFLAYQAFVHSFSFYKLRVSFLMATLLVAAFFFGYLTFFNGQAEILERRLQSFPVYQLLMPQSMSDQERFDVDEK